MNDDEQHGRDDADRAWQNEAAAVLITHEIYARVPIIDGSGLYVSMSAKGSAYVRGWNKRTRELLAERGLPDWSPRQRLSRCKQTLEEGRPASAMSITEFLERATPKERRLLRYRYQPNPDGAESTGVVRVDPDTIVVFLASGEFDLYDVSREQWVGRGPA